MVEQELRVVDYQEKRKAKVFELPNRVHSQEEEKKMGDSKRRDGIHAFSAPNIKEDKNQSTHTLVNPFLIPQPTQRSDLAESVQATPKKFKSPNGLVRDLTDQMSSLDTSMKSPAKDFLDTTVNPQSKNNGSRRK